MDEAMRHEVVQRHQAGASMRAIAKDVGISRGAVAIRRILAAQARPKPLLDELAELHKDGLDPSLREEPVGPRPSSDYQHLLSAEEADEPPSEENPPDKPDEECNQSEPA